MNSGALIARGICPAGGRRRVALHGYKSLQGKDAVDGEIESDGFEGSPTLAAVDPFVDNCVLSRAAAIGLVSSESAVQTLH